MGQEYDLSRIIHQGREVEGGFLNHTGKRLVALGLEVDKRLLHFAHIHARRQKTVRLVAQEIRDPDDRTGTFQFFGVDKNRLRFFIPGCFRYCF